MVPVHENRYFSSMAQSFEAHVRSRGQCPVVVSAARDPEEERRTAEALISYSIDELFIVGATDPDGIHDVCKIAGLPHVNIDLPGSKAAFGYQRQFLWRTNADGSYYSPLRTHDPLRPDDLWLFGGRDDHASRERIAAFHATKMKLLGAAPTKSVQWSGYSPEITLRALEAFHDEHGRLPRALFVNSSINMEGLLRFMSGAPG